MAQIRPVLSCGLKSKLVLGFVKKRLFMHQQLVTSLGKSKALIIT